MSCCPSPLSLLFAFVPDEYLSLSDRRLQGGDVCSRVFAPYVQDGGGSSLHCERSRLYGSLAPNAGHRLLTSFYRTDGLAASVFSKDTNAAYRMASGINAGMVRRLLCSLSLSPCGAHLSSSQVHINGATVHDSAQMPHGGWKKSGYGRFNGIEGIRCVAFSWLEMSKRRQSDSGSFAASLLRRRSSPSMIPILTLSKQWN